MMIMICRIKILLLVAAIFLGISGLAHAATASGSRVVINIPSRTLWLYKGDKIVNYYPVGVGMANFPTPIGSFEVISKVIDPDFENPFKPSGASKIIPGGTPRSPLGTRWMGFYADKGGEFGIHGTNDPGSVGKFSSHGCIRMYVRDAEELFNNIDFGTPIEVTYETILIEDVDDNISLIVYPDRFGKGKPSVDEVKERIMKQYPKAKLNDKVIAQALLNPAEKPVPVGKTTPQSGDPVLSVLGKLSTSESPKDTFAKQALSGASKASN